jgi:hypothetical protein
MEASCPFAASLFEICGRGERDAQPPLPLTSSKSVEQSSANVKIALSETSLVALMFV